MHIQDIWGGRHRRAVERLAEYADEENPDLMVQWALVPEDAVVPIDPKEIFRKEEPNEPEASTRMD